MAKSYNASAAKRAFNRQARQNAYKGLLRQPFTMLAIILVFAALFLFIVFPLSKVFRIGFTVDGRFSLENAATILTGRSYMESFWNSLKLGLIVAVIATLIGFVFAFTITRTDVRWKKFFKFMATIPIISPPFILSLSIIFLFGKQGLVTKEILGISNNIVYGMGSLIVVQSLSFFPVAYLTLSGILEAIDSSVEDAARSMGASRLHVFRTVTLPLAVPGIISALLLVFIQSLEDFSNPAVIGGDFTTLAIKAYNIITGMFDMNKGSMMAILLLLPTLVAYLLNKYWVSKKSFVTVTGKPTQARKNIHEKKITRPLFIFCMAISSFIIILYGTVLVGAFVKAWGRDYTFTLLNFRDAVDLGWRPLQNSIKLAAFSAPIGGFLGMLIAYITVRVRFPGKKIMEIFSVLAFAIPGTVLGIGYVLAFNKMQLTVPSTSVFWAAVIGALLGLIIAFILSLSVKFKKPAVRKAMLFGVPAACAAVGCAITLATPIHLTFTWHWTGTAFILITMFVFRNMPVAVESGTSTLLQIDPAIEEASTILGASRTRTFLKIDLPMLSNAFFSGLVYSYVRAITAVSAIIFIISARWSLVTSKVFNLFEAARYSIAAALVIMMIVVILIAIGVIDLLIKIILKPRARVPKRRSAAKSN